MSVKSKAMLGRYRRFYFLDNINDNDMGLRVGKVKNPIQLYLIVVNLLSPYLSMVSKNKDGSLCRGYIMQNYNICSTVYVIVRILQTNHFGY